MEWNNELILKFLALYKIHPCIWDPTNEGHKSKNAIKDAWFDIQESLGVPCSIKHLKKKRESLLAAYRGYKTKVKKSEMLGAEVYRPSWFAYDLIDSFLGAVYNCKLTLNPWEEHTARASPAGFADDSNNGTEPYIEFHVDSDAGGSEDKPILPDSPGSPTPSRPVLRARRMSRPEPMYNVCVMPERVEKKRHVGPMQQALRRVEEAMEGLRSATAAASARSHAEDDDCDDFGRLVAKKLRKLPEERKDFLMAKVSQMIYNECHTNGRDSDEE